MMLTVLVGVGPRSAGQTGSASCRSEAQTQTDRHVNSNSSNGHAELHPVPALCKFSSPYIDASCSVISGHRY